MMHRMGLVEKIGSGLKRIADMCNEYGSEKPRITADDDWFGISFRRDRNATTRKTTGKTTGKKSEMLLEFLTTHPELTIPEMALHLGLTDDGVRYHLKKLPHNSKGNKSIKFALKGCCTDQI